MVLLEILQFSPMVVLMPMTDLLMIHLSPSWQQEGTREFLMLLAWRRAEELLLVALRWVLSRSAGLRQARLTARYCEMLLIRMASTSLSRM